MNEKIENKQIKENQIIKSDNIIDTLLTDSRIAEKFDQQRLVTLFADINSVITEQYGRIALLGLLKDFQPGDISKNIVIEEIKFLQDQEKEEIDNDIDFLKNQIMVKKQNTNKKVQSTNEKAQNQIEIQKQMQNLQVSYEQIKTLYPIDQNNSNRINFLQQKKTPTLLQTLQANNIDVNQYLEMWYTAEQLIKESNELNEDQIQFVQQFNTLNTSLNIDYQITIPIDKIRDTPKPNNLADIIKTPDAVFAYPSVREYTSKQANIIDKSDKKIDINPKLQQDIWTKLSPKQQEEIQEAIKKNCITNNHPAPVILSAGDSRSRRISDTDNWNNAFEAKKLKGEEKQIQHIIDSILGSYTQDYLITQTNAQTKQLIITQAVAGLASYFDTTTGPTENYARDFDLTKEGNISIEDNILHISGQMHGQIVHFFYNLQTGELQANDYLYKVMQAESFLINDIDQGRYTLPSALPTITELQKTMKNSKYAESMQNNTSLNNYQNTIRKQSDAIKEKFSTQTYNKLYITRTNEKNLFMQETLDVIGGQPRLLKIAGRSMTMDNPSNPIEITRSLHPNEYELLLLLDRTSQTYRSPDQLRIMRNSINRQKQAIQNPRIANGTHNDAVINKLFSQQALREDTENRNNPNKKSNFLLFFDLISNPQNQFGGGILDTNLLEKVIHRIENNQPIAMVEDPKPLEYASDPRYFTEKYGKILYENI